MELLAEYRFRVMDKDGRDGRLATAIAPSHGVAMESVRGRYPAAEIVEERVFLAGRIADSKSKSAVREL